jgi:uncharacterized DUF497 family protein
MELEFDPNKRVWTLEHRGIDFEDAPKIFTGDERTYLDLRFNYGEIRYMTFGDLVGRKVVVIWTPRIRNGRPVHRIISMRKANAKETAALQE